MRGWLFLLSGLILWAVHFFALYAVASIFPLTQLARVLALLVTLLCLEMNALIFLRTIHSHLATPTDGWMNAVSRCGIGLATIAIVWQALPALLS